VIVKLFRVLLLLPIILVIGRLFAQPASDAKVPVPIFAFAFLGLCLVNSAMPLTPALLPLYTPVKALASNVSTWGLLIAISALGLNTSLASITKLGIRHIATVTGTTLVILLTVLAGIHISNNFEPF